MNAAVEEPILTLPMTLLLKAFVLVAGANMAADRAVRFPGSGAGREVQGLARQSPKNRS